VVQERNTNNQPVVEYTRGKDLSGSFQGAGGIGGLLARSQDSLPPTPFYMAHSYYHADGNGNVTMLINASQTMAAKYLYDAFGNTLAQSGYLAAANTYRFSSKEWNANSGLYYYLYRFYDPNLQRWLNWDPLGEEGGLSLYGFVGNDPINDLDAFGLLAGAPLPFPAPPPTLPPILIPKPGPPPVVACTVTFCCFYIATDYVCEKTGFHDWLGDKICKWQNNDRDKCRKDCDDQHDRDSEDCRSRKGKDAQRKCLHDAFDRYSRCLAGCNK